MSATTTEIRVFTSDFVKTWTTHQLLKTYELKNWVLQSEIGKLPLESQSQDYINDSISLKNIANELLARGVKTVSDDGQIQDLKEVKGELPFYAGTSEKITRGIIYLRQNKTEVLIISAAVISLIIGLVIVSTRKKSK